MPVRHKTKSLKECCLKRIALSFDSFWMKPFDEQLKDLPRLMYVVGPFDNLSEYKLLKVDDSHLIAILVIGRILESPVSTPLSNQQTFVHI